MKLRKIIKSFVIISFFFVLSNISLAGTLTINGDVYEIDDIPTQTITNSAEYYILFKYYKSSDLVNPIYRLYFLNDTSNFSYVGRSFISQVGGYDMCTYYMLDNSNNTATISTSYAVSNQGNSYSFPLSFTSSSSNTLLSQAVDLTVLYSSVNFYDISGSDPYTKGSVYYESSSVVIPDDPPVVYDDSVINQVIAMLISFFVIICLLDILSNLKNVVA